MPDILSQTQIDDLLNAISSGELDQHILEESKEEKKVREYDFRRPDKFAKDQLRTLEILHEHLARLININLSAYLRSATEVELVSVESLVYSEFSNSVSNPSIICVLDFSPLEGQLIIDLSIGIGYAMIEKLLGSKESKSTPKPKALTEIEETLIRMFFVRLLDLIKEVWSKIIVLSPSIHSMESNVQYIQLLSPSEPIALVNLNVKIDEISGFLHIAIPYFSLEPIISSLSSRRLFASKYESTDNKENKINISKNLNTIELPVKAIIGSSTMSVYELLCLEPGDVLMLDSKVDSEMTVYVSDQPKFKAVPGVKRKHLAIKLTQILEEGEK